VSLQRSDGVEYELVVVTDSKNRKEHIRMKKHMRLTLLVVFGVLSAMVLVPFGQVAEAQSKLVAPIIFQAAGPTAESIEGTVDAYRAALGDPNNGNAAGPLASGRREINWDGGGPPVDNTTPLPPVTPFNVFLNTRGGQFTTLGIGLTQAPPAGGPEGGLAALFNNPNYETTFSTFSPLRLFTPVGSNVTEAAFFIPGSNGADPATVRGFGAVFTDVDESDGIGPRLKRATPRGDSTRMEYFDRDGRLIFSSFVPASPGDASLSFFGVLFEEAVIARVRITTGNVAPGPDDGEVDIVMMDDFLYSEPQPH
jgi:hypothetical protein